MTVADGFCFGIGLVLAGLATVLSVIVVSLVVAVIGEMFGKAK